MWVGGCNVASKFNAITKPTIMSRGNDTLNADDISGSWMNVKFTELTEKM